MQRIKQCNTPLINFADNDYLGLSQDHAVKTAFAESALSHGLGSGASALISGHHPEHQRLEQRFSEIAGTEASLYLNSGYHANLAIFSALSDRHSQVLADKHIHASLLDGIHLARAQLKRYHHNDLAHCERLLQVNEHSTLIVTESVFSMDGSVTDLNHLNQLATQYSHHIVIDDAHGFGIVNQPWPQLDRVIARVTPLGKAVGSCGAMISGSHELIDSLIQHARSYRYTTALPPAIASATCTALDVMKNQPWRRQKLLDNIQQFQRLCQQRDIDLINTAATPIQCIMTHANNRTMQLQDQLKQRGYFVGAIRPPTVAANQARLRITLSSQHNIEHISGLVKQLSQCLHD